jgi:putative tricarboxylic transport membrane protein
MKVLLLAHQANVDPRRIRYVPFDGGGEAMTSLLGGFIHVFSGEASEIEGQLEAGSLRALAVLAPQRFGGILAGVPTASEQGHEVEWVTWRGFYVPAELSDSAYAEWVSVIRQLQDSDAWAQARRANRLQPFFSVGGDFEALVYGEVERFREMSREIGLIQ